MKISGTAFVKVDGAQLSLAGTMSLDPTRVEREGLVGLSGPVGYKEMNVVPFIEMEVFVTQDTNLETLRNATDVTVTAELANGKVFTLRNAWLASRLPINAVEGTLSIKFEGREMVESGGSAA